MVNKAKLQYSTYMKVAGCGQVDYGISDDFESEGNAGLVNFQQSVCCEVHLGLQKKKMNLLVSIITVFALIDRGRVAFQRFASTDPKHYVFCVSETQNA